MKRRALLKAAAIATSALCSAGWPAQSLLAATRKSNLHTLPGSEAFDYAVLKGLARHLSEQPYVAPADKLPEAIKSLDFYRYESIRSKDESALWNPQQVDNSALRVKFFHPGHLFRNPVRIYEVHAGRARELACGADMFDYSRSGLKPEDIPADLGFAGFRILLQPEWQRDVTAFLGASYFRAVGDRLQFGMSARGLLVDSGLSRPEEFPVFTRFWLERPAAKTAAVTVYALLESPSISGAYRFQIRYEGKRQIMDVDTALYPRKPIERLGIAPLTSMFQYGENDRRAANDWRPEIHDSDGLAIQRGNGEWLWRPLTNPAQLKVNAFSDENPRGFGLFQRDRNFDHYQDDSMYYESRPSVWVEPRNNWGKGAVELIELTANDETFDNIVAYWHPERIPQAGDELLYAYRLHWTGPPAVQTPLARVIATHTGPGGLIGQNVVGRRREFASARYVVDFRGDVLKKTEGPLQPVITISGGELDLVTLQRVDNGEVWRASFDLKPDPSLEPINLRLHLSDGKRVLSETWLYQWTPLK